LRIDLLSQAEQVRATAAVEVPVPDLLAFRLLRLGADGQGSMQATPWLRARIRVPLSRELCTPPVLMPSFRLSMRQQWFAHVRLLVTHLTS
jgi:hypothetical protein